MEEMHGHAASIGAANSTLRDALFRTRSDCIATLSASVTAKLGSKSSPPSTTLSVTCFAEDKTCDSTANNRGGDLFVAAQPAGN